ncbi:MAG: response regulator [Pseudomonadota bacterium]
MARILVVDDDPQIRNLVQQILLRANHQIVLAENGAAALALCKQEAPDLVVTDMMMGGMNGIDFICALGREYPGLRAIAISGANQSADYYLAVAKLIGALKILKKPFTRDELLGAVEEVLQR